MVSSETSHLGDLVHLEVVRDVVVDGKVVIEVGTPAEGEIVAASDRGFIGEPGRVGIGVRSTTTVDGQSVYLRSTLHREGKDKQTLSLVLGLVLCFLFLFMKLSSANRIALSCSGLMVPCGNIPELSKFINSSGIFNFVR